MELPVVAEAGRTAHARQSLAAADPSGMVRWGEKVLHSLESIFGGNLYRAFAMDSGGEGTKNWRGDRAGK